MILRVHLWIWSIRVWLRSLRARWLTGRNIALYVLPGYVVLVGIANLNLEFVAHGIVLHGLVRTYGRLRGWPS